MSEVFKNYFILILIEIGVPPLYEPNQMKFSQKKAQQFFGVETQKAPSLFPYALKNCIVILYFTNQIIPCLLCWVTFCSNVCLRRTCTQHCMFQIFFKNLKTRIAQIQMCVQSQQSALRGRYLIGPICEVRGGLFSARFHIQ